MALSILAGVVVPVPAEAAFDPAYASLEELRAALDDGRTTSVRLLRYYRDRIERFDKRGPRINAFITLNPRAMAEAERADREARAAKNVVGGQSPAGQAPRFGPLHGIPFAAKDNYNTAGIATSGGSAALKASVPSANACVVQKLLDQGAVLIGKTNMSELAASYGRLGYSSAGGLTLNPYNTARDVSGSSSGSAAAVAADFVPFALGTDTGGSVRAPASVAGLVGLRPTLGLTSRSGIVPLALSFDTAGALTRSVRDQAIVLEAIAGVDPADAATAQQVARETTYLSGLEDTRASPNTAGAGAGPGAAAAVAATGRLDGVRLGVITNFRGGNPEVDGVERAALVRLEARGAVLVSITLPVAFEKLWDGVLGPVGDAEFKPQFERYLHALPPGDIKTLADLVRVSSAPGIASSATPVNPPRLEALRVAEAGRLTDSPLYIHLLTDAIPALRGELLTVLERQRLDAFVFATMSCPASPRFDRVDPTYVCGTDDPYKASYLAAATGFPELSVPAGRVGANLPVGLSFMGAPWGERRLLRIGEVFSRAGTPLPRPALR